MFIYVVAVASIAHISFYFFEKPAKIFLRHKFIK
jgi:hypothetical protein